MRALSSRLLVFAALFSVMGLLAAGSAHAQGAIPLIKYPSGPDVTSSGPGQFACPVGGTARWIVVIDNSGGFAPISGATFDDDLSGRPMPCSPDGNACNGVSFLDLICPASPDPDAPSGPPTSVITCDPVANTISITGINVAPGGIGCIEFSTVVLAGGIGQQIGNLGCLTVAPQVFPTRPPAISPAGCAAGITSAPTPGCSLLFVPSVQPPRFKAIKTGTFTDLDGDGVLSVGDQITWTVDMTNDTTDAQTAFAFDAIPAGSTFLDITTNPDAACAFDVAGDEIQCPSLSFAGSETKQLVFRTTVACTVFPDVLDAGGSGVCNQAQVCTDGTRSNCFLSDDDGTFPANEQTCIAFPRAVFTSSEKTWTFVDSDSDGGVSDGDRLTFSITVRNSGDAIATAVQVTDALNSSCLNTATVDPGTGTFNGGTNTITWDVGDIAIGGSRTITFSVDALGAGPTCCNQAFITDQARRDCSAPGVPTNDPGTAPPSDTTCVRFGPQPVLQVTKDWTLITDTNGNGIPEDTDVIEWIVTVTNVGGAAATGVAITDTIAPCQQGFDPVAVTITGGGTNNSRGESPPFDAGVVQVDDAGGPGGIAGGGGTVEVRFRTTLRNITPCCNRATVTYAESVVPVDSDDPVTPGPPDQTCTTRNLGAALLSVTKTASDADADGCFEPGETITYTLTVSVANADAMSLSLADVVTDPGNVLSVVDTGGGTYNPGLNTITWNIGNVAIGFSDTYIWTGTIQCDAADTTAFSDTATATATGATPASDSVNSTVSAAVLSVQKTGRLFRDFNLNNVIDPGDVIQFDITVRNTGSCASTAVSVSDQLDVDLDFTAVNMVDPGIDDGSGGLTWNSTTTPALASLVPGGTPVVLRVQAPALDPATNPAPAADGDINNDATAEASAAFTCPGPKGTDSSPTLTIGAVGPRLEVTKVQSDADGDGCAEPGEVITFTITVTPRDGAAAGVILGDVISDPSNVLTNIDAGTGTYDSASSSITWNLGAIAQDATQTLTWSATIACGSADGTTVDDQATAFGVGVAVGTASLTTTVAAPALGVDKTVTYADANSNGALDPGEIVTFSLALRNSSSCVAATNVVVTDTMDTDLDGATITPSNGGSVALGTVTWNAGTTPALASFGPGATLTLTVTAVALDPATNPSGDSLVNNRAEVTADAANGCSAPATSDSLDAAAGEVFQVGGGAPANTLLRNDAISCRLTGFVAIRSLGILVTRGGASECSNPAAIQTAQAETDVISTGPTGTYTFVGDATAGTDTCPQLGSGPGRVLIFYEVTDAACPGAITSVRLGKVGGDVVMDW